MTGPDPNHEPEPLRVGPLAAATRPSEDLRLSPVQAPERLHSLDLLRGFAVLGMLIPNILIFAMPFAALSDPTSLGAASRLDWAAWAFIHVLWDQKAFPIFTLLFGAGIVLLSAKAERAGRRLGWLYVKRHFWLLVIGLVHAYVLWWGDILVSYALCALLLYFFRRRTARTLLVVGLLVYSVALLGGSVMGMQFGQMRAEVERIESARTAGATPSAEEERRVEQWNAIRPFIAPTGEELDSQVARLRDGSFGEIVEYAAPVVFQTQTLGFLTYSFWRVAGLMLVGMALMKLEIFAGVRPDVFYRRLALWGIVLGVLLGAASAWSLVAHDFDPVHQATLGIYFVLVGFPILSLGYAGAILLAWRRGLAETVQRRLRAVGRMALTNYLAQSVLLTWVFYGWGLGLYGSLGRTLLLVIALTLCALQIAWSEPWLRRFEFGPVEWLWRSLTYGRLQPLRRPPART